MRILIAPNAFKGTLAADEAAGIAGKIISEQMPDSEVLLQAIADGGDGTCSLLIRSLHLEKIKSLSLDPIGRPISCEIGWDENTQKAYMDISTSSGIAGLEEYQRQAHLTSTYGTGILIRKAIEIGAKEIVLGLGGSATVDMGLGILQAFGFVFLDQKGREISPFSPDFFSRIKHIQRPMSLPQVKFTCLCDVRNFFFGEKGAVPVFGPQKGIKTEHLSEYENHCRRVFDLLVKKSKITWQDQEGFGAAGGIAMGLDLFFPVEIQFGAPHFFDLVDIKSKVQICDWVLTGEGRYDSQSDEGKACFELLQVAKSMRKRIALITSGDEAESAGFDIVLRLPNLDFSKDGWKEKARENFHRLIFDFVRKAQTS